MIANVLNMTQKIRDTGIHPKVDEEQWRVAQRNKRRVVGWGTLKNNLYMSGLRHISCSSYIIYILRATVYAPDGIIRRNKGVSRQKKRRDRPQTTK